MSNTTPVKQYACLELPFDNASVEKWLDKYVAYRLHALQSEPASFAEPYEREKMKSRDEWKALLTTPAYRIIVCVYSTERTPLEPWDCEWAGILLLYGPSTVASAQRPIYDIVWFMSGLYASPQHRKGKIGSRLVAAVIELKRVPQSEDLLKDTQLLQCRVKMHGIVNPAKPGLKRYYETFGLRHLRQMRRSEYLSSWGIQSPPGCNERDTIVMEIICDHTLKKSSHM